MFIFQLPAMIAFLIILYFLFKCNLFLLMKEKGETRSPFHVRFLFIVQTSDTGENFALEKL